MNTQTATVQPVAQAMDSNTERLNWFTINGVPAIGLFTREGVVCSCENSNDCWHQQQYRLWLERQGLQSLHESAPSVTTEMPAPANIPPSAQTRLTHQPSHTREHSPLFAIIRRSMRTKDKSLPLWPVSNCSKP